MHGLLAHGSKTRGLWLRRMNGHRVLLLLHLSSMVRMVLLLLLLRMMRRHLHHLMTVMMLSVGRWLLTMAHHSVLSHR